MPTSSPSHPFNLPAAAMHAAGTKITWQMQLRPVHDKPPQTQAVKKCQWLKATRTTDDRLLMLCPAVVTKAPPDSLGSGKTDCVATLCDTTPLQSATHIQHAIAAVQLNTHTRCPAHQPISRHENFMRPFGGSKKMRMQITARLHGLFTEMGVARSQHLSGL